MFAYCDNNPVNRADPTGHSWKSFWGKVGNAIKEAASAVVKAVSSVFGLSYSSTTSHTNKPTIKSPSWMPVQFEHGTSSTTTIVQNGTLSKPIVLHAKQDYGTAGVSYGAGAQLSAFSASLDLSGSVSRTNTGVYFSSGYRNNTTQVGVRINFEELKLGIETSTSYKQGNICVTEYSNLSINGVGLLTIVAGLYTGQIDYGYFAYQSGYIY